MNSLSLHPSHHDTVLTSQIFLASTMISQIYDWSRCVRAFFFLGSFLPISSSFHCIWWTRYDRPLALRLPTLPLPNNPCLFRSATVFELLLFTNQWLILKISTDWTWLWLTAPRMHWLLLALSDCQECRGNVHQDVCKIITTNQFECPRYSGMHCNKIISCDSKQTQLYINLLLFA